MPAQTITPPSPPSPSGPELLDVKAVAALLGVSVRHVHRLVALKRIPAPVNLGTKSDRPNALIRFRRDQLDTWIKAGCPASGGGK